MFSSNDSKHFFSHSNVQVNHISNKYNVISRAILNFCIIVYVNNYTNTNYLYFCGASIPFSKVFHSCDFSPLRRRCCVSFGFDCSQRLLVVSAACFSLSLFQLCSCCVLVSGWVLVPPSDGGSFWVDVVWYPNVNGYSLASRLPFRFRWN
jgi:hypothetical protein